jgi:hypothetical protein
MTQTEDQPIEIIPVKSERARHLEKYQKRFQPGQSGNPGGRPRSAPLTKALRELCDEVDEKTGLDGAQMLARALFKEGLKGNVWAFSKIADLVEGRIVSAISAEITGNAESYGQSVKLKLIQKLVRTEELPAASEGEQTQ